jgi:hypothetical protein
MKFLDFDKCRQFRYSSPLIFWSACALISILLMTGWIFFLSSLLKGDDILLLMKNASTVSKQNHPIGYYLAILWDLFILNIFSYFAYTIIFKTKK